MLKKLISKQALQEVFLLKFTDFFTKNLFFQ